MGDLQQTKLPFAVFSNTLQIIGLHTDSGGAIMVLFTEDAMNRPLFEEPGPHMERVDPWSGPQGFLLEGMSEYAD